MANERILVVDDEPGVVRSCTRILERHGFTVSGQTNSADVPPLLKQSTFDLLLTDIKMPRIDGLTLLKLAKEIDPHITVVLITGYGTMEDAIEAIQLGAQGFLMKPFEPEDLVSTVKDNLARRALIRDSLRLQTLLPLLEINQMLQVSGGEVSLVRQAMDVAQQAIGARRMAWLRYTNSNTETVIVPDQCGPSTLPEAAIQQVRATRQPVWVTGDGDLLRQPGGQPNIVGVVLPLLVSGEVVGLLTAETGGDDLSGPFGRIGLELLSVLAGQLAIVIENVRLFQQTELLRTFNEDIIQNMTNGLIAVSGRQCITVFNPAAAQMLGYEAEQVFGQSLARLFHETETLIEMFSRTATTGQPQPRREISVPHRDGRIIPISVSTAPLKQDEQNGQAVGVVGVIEDLSEIKAFEAERRRLDRLAALGEMSAVVAHEIRNPVAGIAAGVDYLTRHAADGSTEAEGAALIQSEVKRVNRILEDILFVARPLQLDLTEISLPTIIEKVLQRCHPQAQANNVAITVDFDAQLPSLRVDSHRLEQVFSNLVTNAIQAMPTGGQVRLSAQAEGAEAVITIADDGPGIPAESRLRIFEPFFTTKTKGTGLGLSIARRIIEAHRGTIRLESENGTGTRFTIHLPTLPKAH